MVSAEISYMVGSSLANLSTGGLDLILAFGQIGIYGVIIYTFILGIAAVVGRKHGKK